MPQEKPARKPYPSDLTDGQWAMLAPLIPAAHRKHGGRPRAVDMRDVVHTILFLHRSGCQWEMLPHDWLPKSTVYDYVRLLYAVARRWHVGHHACGVARTDPPARRSGAHPQCGLPR
jgi:transposase